VPSRTLRRAMEILGDHPLLTAREEKELARLSREGNEEARQQLIRCNLKLVASVAGKFAKKLNQSSRNDLIDLNDLVQDGILGLRFPESAITSSAGSTTPSLPSASRPT